MICYQLEEMDEGTDLGLFGSLQKAKDAYAVYLDERIEVTWAEQREGVWWGSIDGDVVATILRRKIH